MATVTEQILFSGHVQGVGFRWTTQRLAAGLPVSGYVRNLADGRVELVATGAPATISRLVDRLRDHFGSGISAIERNPRVEVEEFSGFAIRQ